MYQDIIEDKTLRLRNTHSVLLVDGWKNNVTNEKQLVFTARNGNTSQTIIHAENMSSELEDETGESLSKVINDVIKICSEKYDTEICAIKMDNDSKIKRSGRNATCYELDQDLWVTTCASHSGNLFFSTLKRKIKFFSKKLMI